MEDNESLKFKDVKFQYLAVCCVNIITLCHGSAIGWLSPSLAVLRSEDSPLHTGPITTSQVSWIGSYFSIGSIIGNVVFGVCTKFLGLKKTIFLLALPNIGFWLTVLLGSEAFHLYIGRTLAGITGGGIYVCIPLFVSEIADRKIRGALGSLLMVICCTGILLSFVAGSYLDYGTVPYVFIFLPLIFMSGFLFLPETPHNLLAHNNFKGAEASYIFYRRGNNLNGRETKDITVELQNLQTVLKTRNEEKQNSNVLRDLCTWPALKGILTGFCLTGLNLFSGTFAMINYTGTIFKESGSNIDPNTSSIIVAAIQVVGVYLSTLLVDRVGRKTLLIISSSGAAIALALLGTFSYLHEQEVDLIHFNWVPLVSFSFYVFISCIGVLPLPFVILAEILPPKIRDIGSTICMVSISVFAFISLKLFPVIIDSLGLYVAMWICCGVCVLGVAFSIFILKETKGKNLNTLDEK